MVDRRPAADSFAAGLHDRQVTTEHGGRSFGIQIDLVPQAAHMLFGVPMHTLAGAKVPLEDVLRPVSRRASLRRGRLDSPLRAPGRDVGRAPGACSSSAAPGVAWAWRRLVETDGRIAIGDLGGELGWSRKRIVARFRKEIGLSPKAAARVLRFERARRSAERSESPDWAEIAFECGYYDQSHLINEFRAVTDRTPATFFQDELAPTQ